MTEEQVMQHLANPWLNDDEVMRLRKNIERYLASVNPLRV